MRGFDLPDTTFDIAIIGGGIVGAGIARDAARRGLRVIILEREDFGGGTTAHSTRLVHGGLRYLATADFRLVRLDLRERETLLRIAPHLVTPLSFLLPFLAGRRLDAWRVRAGMWLYDALSFDKTLPSHRLLNAAVLRDVEPGLAPDMVTGAAQFFDAQVHSPERLTLENIIDAHAHGATAVTYAEVSGALRDGDRIVGVTAVDRRSGRAHQVRARLVVNAAGPWFDRVAARLELAPAAMVRMTKGVHIACAPFTRQAVVLRSSVDARVVFAIPWAGYTWLGTTDTDFSGDPATAAATDADVRYLIDSVAPYFPAARTAQRHWTTAGVRALALSGGSASAVSRMHQVVANVPGFVSVVGGKITGYRAIAEEVTDVICQRLGIVEPVSTSRVPLPGGGAARSGVAHLDAIYGSRAVDVVALANDEPALRATIAAPYPDIAAQVAFSVRHEWCERLDDFMLRRSYLGFQHDRGTRAADAVSRLMQRELAWSDEQRRDEVARYLAKISTEFAGTTIRAE